jgi:predicted dehydrogenase
MQRLNLGIIGTGVAARILHWPALRQLSDRYRIVAVANRTRSKGEAFADMIGLDPASVYSDYRDLLARDDVDVVDLALPPSMNAEVAQAAAERGIHVICEKPLSVSLEAAQAMVALPDAYGVRVLVAENFRYENSVQRARCLIEDGAIQPPFMISYRWMQPVPPDDEIAARPWRKEPLHAGGFLSDHGIHMIDVVRYLMGDVAAVQVFAADRRRFLAGLDNAVYNLAFSSGAIGSIQWSFTVNSELAWHIQLWSDDGTMTVGPHQLAIRRQGEQAETFAVTGPSSFVNEFEDFYQAIVNGRPAHMTLQDGILDLRTVLAAHQSVVNREVVFLDRTVSEG